MTIETAVATLEAATRQPCRVCGGRGWKDLESEHPIPCDRCKPYGARVATSTSVFAPGDRVLHRYTQRVGVVLRTWRRTQGAKRPGPHVYCDVRYDIAAPGVAWEGDLVPTA